MPLLLLLLFFADCLSPNPDPASADMASQRLQDPGVPPLRLCAQIGDCEDTGPDMGFIPAQ